jgi:hypothetical protein
MVRHRSRFVCYGFEKARLSVQYHQNHWRICVFRDYARDVLNPAITDTQLVRLFAVNERPVRRNLLHGPQAPGPLGRHIPIQHQSEADLITLILEASAAGKTMAWEQLPLIIREQSNPKPTRRWINACIGRHLDAREIRLSLPQEDTRLTVPRGILGSTSRQRRVTCLGGVQNLFLI